ncbi:MAG: STAS domain-containing protein [Bryobacterales bacterium]|nr:STAS domain-containing protein [Bryobacterales bacterium]MDE0293491.1 STAS domain-containing protein [Bryobacterales bacterium]MDE0434752.1 STAS domain-containing protein [Bryobacterales bacterium]
MDLNIKRVGTRSVVYVEGDIDLYSSPELRETVLDLFRKRQQEQIIVNLAEVPYIDSSGIASLVEGLQEARKQNRRFVLVGLREGPRHVLELTRLLNVFEIAETEEAVT